MSGMSSPENWESCGCEYTGGTRHGSIARGSREILLARIKKECLEFGHVGLDGRTWARMRALARANVAYDGLYDMARGAGMEMARGSQRRSAAAALLIMITH